MAPKSLMFLLLFTQWVTVMSQVTAPANQILGFPPQPQDFKEVVKKLMISCSKKGFSPPILKDYLLSSTSPKPNMLGNPVALFPSVLSSLPSLYTSMPRTILRADLDPASNLTDKMWNSSSLTQMIDMMRNATDKTNCFLRALASPLSWGVVIKNASQYDIDSFRKLLWASKPFLESAPFPLALPPTMQSAQLPEMMNALSEVFGSLSEEQRDGIRRWMKDRIIENDPICRQNESLSFISKILMPLLPSNPRLFNASSPGCPPKMPWLKADGLRMMGRFVSRLPEEELKAIPTDELCKFYQSLEFLSSFTSVSGMNTAVGRTFLKRLKQECFTIRQNFLNQMDRLGNLVCFFEEAQSLNSTQSKMLLSYIGECDNYGTDTLKRDLVRKLMVDDRAPATADLILSLGAGVSILPPYKLSNISADTLNSTIASLRQAEWKPAQAKILVQKLLDKAKNITGEKLLSLGSMVRGVDTDLLKKVKAQGLLGNEILKNISEKMSALQKKALLMGLRGDANATDLVKEVPDSLVPSLSFSTLDKAGLTSVDQLDGRSWTRTQSLYLLKRIVSAAMKPDQIRKLGLAVQGLTCGMIENISQSDALETAQTLSKSPNLLSRAQVHCMAVKLFQSLEAQRPGYFTNLSDSELQAIPAMLLIHLPVKDIQGLPAAVCPRFLEKINQISLSFLPNSAPSRTELRNKALSCLGKSASDLSAAEVLYLGPLVCELDPAWMSSLNPEALNSTLQAMASCRNIPSYNRGPLFTLLTKVYGDPSNWTEDTLKSVGSLLLLNSSALEMLKSNTWLKQSLSDLLDSLTAQTGNPAPDEFRAWFDLSGLQRKLFQLKTATPQLRRRRATLIPTLQMIQDLGLTNVYWSAAQLASMTTQTFQDSISILGEIRNYSEEQLAALRTKAIEAWGDVSKLNESKIIEMGCVSQSFDPNQLQSLSINSVDTLNLLSVCQFNQTQIEALWRGFVARTGTQSSTLGAVELSGLGNFICGLQPTAIGQLNTAEFRDAVADVGRAQCPLTVMECLKNKAKAAFGNPLDWGEADVSALGNIIAGLNCSELGSLNPKVLPCISQSAISLIAPDSLATLSVSQLKALGPDNAAALTPTQLAALGPEQRAAVAESLGLPTRTSSIPLTAGAPRQSMLGIVVLVQPLALLLLGFIL